MIAPQSFNNYPEFGTAAVKCRPDDTKYANGYIQGDVFPAEHVNWFFYGATVGVSALQLGMNSLEHEMQTLLCCAGKSASADCCSQVYESISYLIEQSANTKAPKSHASSANTYGVGTASNYGHLKISDTYTSVLSACSGVAASQMAVACVYGVANGKPDLGSTTACPLGTASAGTSTTAARSDHVHKKPTRAELGLGTAADCAASAFRSCTWTPTCVCCAGRDGSGCAFGTAARYSCSCFRPVTWTPTCVACAGVAERATCADGATSATNAANACLAKCTYIYCVGCCATWNWTDGGSPGWLWGGNNGKDMYVYNPSNLSVKNAQCLCGRTVKDIEGWYTCQYGNAYGYYNMNTAQWIVRIVSGAYECDIYKALAWARAFDQTATYYRAGVVGRMQYGDTEYVANSLVFYGSQHCIIIGPSGLSNCFTIEKDKLCQWSAFTVGGQS